LSRAREQTDIYTARDDLGHQGIDADAIGRLAERISESHAQEASITRTEIDQPARPEGVEPSFGERLSAALEHRPDAARDGDRDGEPQSWFAQQLDEIRRQQAERALENDRSEGFEL
jgi:hypothetical protein